ncbi:tetratricopeptide repeat protein [Mycolicibacter arupensis]|uniref:tetratricopeptide repeat protein n=1 Tax=Mycolicibacter arupensis TaxID=342002 RepID=UPI001F39AD8C|nr:tetratricopeptide repeat protein [Mycolicibacter arupensis]
MSTADEPTAEPADEAATEDAAEEVGPTTEGPKPMAVEETTEVVLAVLRRYLVRLFRRFGYSVSVVAVFSLVAGLGWQLWQQHRVAAAESAAQDAAVHYAQVLTSIDSNKVDDDFAAVLNGATGDFKDTYTKASVQLRQLLIDNKATAQGTVVQSAVQSGSRDEVVVLLMVNQAVTNTNRPDPRVDRTRMKMTMTRVDGRWLASKVELP